MSKELTLEDYPVMAQKLLNSRKYRELNIPIETVLDLIGQENSIHANSKLVEKNVREKLHQIIAPYLGEPDYTALAEELKQISCSEREKIKEWCLKVLGTHASSKERIPFMENFYTQIFSVCYKPAEIHDLACAMNPFAFPWMGLSDTTRYYAYDIHQPRIDLINLFFEKWGLEPLSEMRDVLLDPPNCSDGTAFFFKEAHRFESRQKGCCKAFWRNIQAEQLIVTLPAENLTGQHQMRERQRYLVNTNISGLDYSLTELEVCGEMIFCLQKSSTSDPLPNDKSKTRE